MRAKNIKKRFQERVWLHFKYNFKSVDRLYLLLLINFYINNKWIIGDKIWILINSSYANDFFSRSKLKWILFFCTDHWETHVIVLKL